MHDPLLLRVGGVECLRGALLLREQNSKQSPATVSFGFSLERENLLQKSIFLISESVDTDPADNGVLLYFWGNPFSLRLLGGSPLSSEGVKLKGVDDVTNPATQDRPRAVNPGSTGGC